MAEIEIVEVHNCWTVYGLHADGTELEQPVAALSRPQDWGDPRWYYERFCFERIVKNKHFISHAHCWTDIKQQPFEYPHLFAPLIVQILIPGNNEKLCGRDYLDTDDFWCDEWGPMPAYYEEEERYGEDDTEGKFYL